MATFPSDEDHHLERFFFGVFQYWLLQCGQRRGEATRGIHLPKHRRHVRDGSLIVVGAIIGLTKAVYP